MPKILILASISKAFYNFSFEFLERMIELGYEVTIAIPDDPLNAEFARIGCRVVPSRLVRHGMNPLAELALIGEYCRLCRQVKPDVVMTFTIKPNTYGGAVARWFGLPYLACVTGMGTVFFNPTAIHAVIVRMLKFGIGKARCVFFQNEANREVFLAKRLLSGPVRLIPGSGVNLSQRPLLPYPPEAEEKVRFIMLARASREKGVAEYLDAAAQIRATHPECEFHYAGFTEESQYGRMVEAAHAAGVIVNHGFLNNGEVERLMAGMHAVVLPSYHEGMSNVLLEGAAYGRPLLTTAVPGCREAVEDGVSGLLFAPQSAVALIAALERFLGMSPVAREAMGRAGRRRMESLFDRRLTVAAYLEEIARILDSNAASAGEGRT